MVSTLKPILRPWITWTIASVWVGTAIAVGALSLIHKSTTATLTVHVREVRFPTDPGTIFDPIDQHQFTIAGMAEADISTGGSAGSGATLDVKLTDGTSACNFYNVRTGPLKLLAESEIVLLWPKRADVNSFSIRSSGAISGTVIPMSDGGTDSVFQCSDVEGGAGSVKMLKGSLSTAFDSSFLTKGHALLNYHSMTNTLPGEQQVRVSGNMNVFHADFAASKEEKATLLEPLPDQFNQVVFDEFSRKVPLSVNDLVIVKPGADFYIRKLVIERGIQIEGHGTVNDILVGAGSQNYKSVMPSLFETLDRQKRLFTVVPSIVAFIAGVLEAVGLLPKKGS
jgi:hypothetical protein